MNAITFSTLACPGWSIETVISNAAGYGYDGIEWRGGPQGHVQPNMSSEQIRLMRQKCSDAGLESLSITAYTSFVSDSTDERRANVDELRQYADMAAELGAKYVRTFLGELPKDTKISAPLYKKISECLRQAADHAQTSGVIIAVEPHDDFVRSTTIVPILSQVPHPALRVIWDIANAFAAGEDPAEGFVLLKDRLAYVQVKDGKRFGYNWQLDSFGKGNVPLDLAFELLMAHNYLGALSVEWEYAWHPELDPPEIALPIALRTVQNLLSAAQAESV